MVSNGVSNNQCVLCARTYTNDHVHCATVLDCGHAFGRSCIAEWQENNSDCPTCRRPSATPEDPSDTSLITRIKKQFNSNKFPYCLLAGASYLYNPNPTEIVGWSVGFGAMSLGTFGLLRACTPIVNLIRWCLGCELVKPMQLREIEPHCIICCSLIIGSSIASKLTINPQHEHLRWTGTPG